MIFSLSGPNTAPLLLWGQEPERPKEPQPPLLPLLPAKGFSSIATPGKLAPFLHLPHSLLSRFSPPVSKQRRGNTLLHLLQHRNHPHTKLTPSKNHRITTWVTCDRMTTPLGTDIVFNITGLSFVILMCLNLLLFVLFLFYLCII